MNKAAVVVFEAIAWPFKKLFEFLEAWGPWLVIASIVSTAVLWLVAPRTFNYLSAYLLAWFALILACHVVYLINSIEEDPPEYPNTPSGTLLDWIEGWLKRVALLALECGALYGVWAVISTGLH